MSRTVDDETEDYEFPSFREQPILKISRSIPSTDEGVVMRLDLGSLDVDAATRPSWSQAGDDPLIVGGDELQ